MICLMFLFCCLEQEDIQEEMLKYSLPVEPLVDPATNAARIQTRTCRGEAAVCEFDNSILSPVASPLDPAAIDQNTTTRSAFNLYAGLGESFFVFIFISVSAFVFICLCF